jgi:hypothetical protein
VTNLLALRIDRLLHKQRTEMTFLNQEGAHFFTLKPKVEFSLPSVLGVGGCDEHKVK